MKKVVHVDGLAEIVPESECVYVMGRGYADLARLDYIHPASVFELGEPGAVGDASHLRCGQGGGDLETAKSKRNSPAGLCCVRFFDPETGKKLVFVPNHFAPLAIVITHMDSADRSHRPILLTRRRPNRLFLE